MRLYASLLFLLFSATALMSCASLTKEECLSSDWNIIGQRDGAQGHNPQTQFRRHISACEKVNVTPDHVQWTQGYQQGLLNYCTPVKGLTVGQQGATYHNVCPANSEGGFLRGYVLGKKENSVRSDISSLKAQSDGINSEIDALLDKAASSNATDQAAIKADIRQKRSQLDVITEEKERSVYRLSTLQNLVDQFLANPDLIYDPSLL